MKIKTNKLTHTYILYNVWFTRIKTNQIDPYVHSFVDINANSDDYTELIQISERNYRNDKYKTKKIDILYKISLASNWPINTWLYEIWIIR